MLFLIKLIITVSIFSLIGHYNQVFNFGDDLFKYYRLSKMKMFFIVVLIILLIIDFKLIILYVVVYLIYRIAHPRYLKKRNKRLIEFYGYKIFKYLMNQISSGILISDGIKSMYRVVDHIELRTCLIEVSAHYSRTSDISASLMILKQQFKGLEVDTLCLAISQGIHTGTNYETLNKLEMLLFKRYLNQIKLETGWQRRRSILSVLLLCTVMVLMIAVPVIMDIMDAFNQIFLF